MKKTIVSLFVVLASITLEAQAQIRDHAGMSILQPQGLKNWWDSNIQETHTSIASFGSIPWGRKIIGRLSLADPEDACDYIRIKDDQPTNPVLVAQRGNCPFYMKAHYAQLAGAKMLIITDNTYEDVETKLMVDTGGQGESVHIPSALLAKKAGEKIKDSLTDTDPTISNVHMVFDFYLSKSAQVEYRLWLSSSNSQTFRFLREWKQYYTKLESVAKMEPHFAHFKTFGVEGDTSIDNCICGNKYCTTDPDGELQNTGRDVVYEDLRQMCILDKLGIDSWWDYVLKYDDICLTGGKMADCSTKTMDAVGIDAERINSCVKKSFDNESPELCTSNTYLEKEAEKIAKDGVILFPSVVINSFTYRGNLVPAKGVFETICESFNDIPSVCTPALAVPGTITKTPSHTPVVIAAVFFLIFFGLFVFCCYRRYLKREMYKQMVRDVNIAVSQYIAFKDDESFTKEKDEH